MVAAGSPLELVGEHQMEEHVAELTRFGTVDGIDHVLGTPTHQKGRKSLRA